MMKHLKRFVAITISMVMAFQFCTNDFYLYAETEPADPGQTQVTNEPESEPSDSTGEAAEETLSSDTGTPEPSAPVEEQPAAPVEEQPAAPVEEQPEVASTLKVEFVDANNTSVKETVEQALTSKYVKDTINLDELGIDTNVEGYTLTEVKDKNDNTQAYTTETKDFVLTGNVTELQFVYTQNVQTDQPEDSQEPSTPQGGQEDQNSEEDQEDTDDEDSDSQTNEGENESADSSKDDELAYPEQILSATASDGAIITIIAKEGALPEGAEVVVEPVESDSIAQIVEDALSQEGKELQTYKAYDITILLDDEEIQPKVPIQVGITGSGVTGSEKSLFHIADGSSKADKVSVIDSGSTQTFSAEGFSIYVVTESGVSLLDIEGDTSLIVGETVELRCDRWHTHNWWTNKDGVVTIQEWESKAYVKAIAPGNVTINCGLFNSIDITVSAEQGQNIAYFYVQRSGKDPVSLDSKDWMYVGTGTIDTTNIKNTAGGELLPGKSQYSLDVNGRIISWPDEDVIKQRIANLYGIDINDPDLVITYTPFKISYPMGYKDENDISHENDTPCYHVDMAVSIQTKEKASQNYYLWDAGENLGYQPIESWDVNIGETTSPTKQYPPTKIVDGKEYVFKGWYLDKELTQKVTFPYTVEKANNFYAKYVLKDATLTVDDPESVPYDGKEHKWVPTVKNGSYVLDESEYDVIYSTEDFVNVQEITVTIIGKGDYAGQEVSKTYSITQRNLEVYAEDSRPYNGSNQTLEITNKDLYNNTTLAEGDELTITATITGRDADTYTTLDDGYSWEIKNKDAEDVTHNYNITVTGKLTITKAGSEQYQGTVTLDDWTYGEEAAVENASVTGGDYGNPTYQYKNKDAGDETYTPVKPSDAGEYTVKATWAGTDNCKEITATDDFTINKRNLEVYAEDSRPYNGSNQTLEITNKDLYNNTTLAEGDELTITATITGRDADTYTTLDDGYSWEIKNKDAEDVTHNYNITVTGKLTITKAGSEQYQGTVTLDDWTYGEEAAVENASVTGGDYGNPTYQYKNKDAGDETYTPVKPSDAGEYTVKATWAGTDNCKEITATDDFTISPRQITLTSGSASKNYDGTALTNSEVSITSGSLVNASDVTYAAVGSITNVGSIANTIEVGYANAQMDANYDVTVEEGTLTVYAQSIDPEDPHDPDPEDPEQPVYMGVDTNSPSNVVYDGAAHQWLPTVTAEDGTVLVLGTDYNVTYSTTDFTNVTGEIVITITGAGNYAGEITRTYQITPRPVTLTSGSASKNYDGTALTNSEVTITSGSLVNASDVTYAAVGSITNVGSSLNRISVSYASEQMARNYVVTLVEGTLTVNTAPTTPTTPPTTPTTPPTTPGTPGTTTDDGATTDEPEVEEVEDEETPLSDGDVEDVEDNATPKGNNGIWALINLIAAIVTVILGLILLLSKRHRNDEEEDEEERQARIERGEEKEQEQKRGWICKVLGVIVAIVSVVFFILTEDMSLPMALTDKWTIWMIVIAIVELVLVLVGRHWKDVDDEDQEQQA